MFSLTNILLLLAWLIYIGLLLFIFSETLKKIYEAYLITKKSNDAILILQKFGKNIFQGMSKDGTICYSIFDEILSQEQFRTFQFLWNNTKLKRNKKLMKIFVKLSKME